MTNTVSVKIPFSGFYESSHEAMFDGWLDYEIDVLNDEHELTQEDKDKLTEMFSDAIDWKKAHELYAKEYCKQLVAYIANESREYKEDSTGKQYLSAPFELELEFETLESPKYYNYGTDCIYGKIPLEQLQYMLNEIPDKEWREYVKRKCTSYSGFHSFYSPDFDEWEKDLSEWGEARLGMVLEAYLIYLLDDNHLDALDGHRLMADADANGFISDTIFECANQEFNEFCDSLRKDG